MNENLKTAARLVWYVLMRPPLLAGVLAVMLFLLTEHYGFIGFLVLASNPIFLALVMWAVGLYYIAKIRPFLNQFSKQTALWLKKKIVGFSPEIEEDDHPGMVASASACLEGICDAIAP